MSKGKQCTLFQSWGQKKKVEQSNSSAVIDLCNELDEDDDELLAEAVENSLIDYDNGSKLDTSSAHQTDVCNISLGAENFPSMTQACTSQTGPQGFDRSAGKLWIYPTNYPVREYQFNIVGQALKKNTMVTLPTGLGKTFIAAVVMYNFFRWYPQGKVVFMAPTKPLVAQQIEACYNIMGIPQDDTAEMTGTMAPTERRKVWMEKRVFFLTPQVIMNDLSRGTCPAVDVRCLVIDEAHKATGNHAYCQVVRELIKYTSDFRILALSATPGGDIKAVQQVLNNLLISHIELRTEESPDIKQYSHERKVDKIVVPLGSELTEVKKKYVQIMEVTVNKLKRHGVIYNRDATSLSKFLILKSREDFRQNPPPNLQRSHYGIVEGDFALAMSLYHGFELLQLHGSRSLYNYLDGILHGDKAYGRTKTELSRNPDFNDLMNILQEKFAPVECRPSQSDGSKKPLATGHPKMEKLEQVVLDHFNTYNAGDGETRVMIFSQYRDSVSEITNILKQHHPLVKVMSFIGQSSAGKSTKGFTQKEQLKVMKDFREGGYNTLVSTCVGEEGLDIGDVDLIVCFDAHKSPIRLVQRMGRTGRKREGRIVMLVTEGKEEQIYNQSQYSKKSIHKAILNSAKTLHFYPNNPAMLPDNWNPQCHKMFISVNKKFKPAKASSSHGNQSKLTSVINANKDKKNDGDGGISKEEYEELMKFYGGEKGKTLPQPSPMLSLGETVQEKDNGTLSLSEWSLWQNKPQPTFLIDHSLRTKHFVEVTQFLEVQEALDPEEDNYGQEMDVFLNETDILKPGQTDEDVGSIKQFFVPTDSTNKPGKKKSLLNKARRSDQLPDFDEFVRSGDSDDELPNVFGKESETAKANITQKSPKLVQATLKKSKPKKRNSSGNVSIIDVIVHNDNNDFRGFDLPDIEEESQSNNLKDKINEPNASDKTENLCHPASEMENQCEDFTKLLPTFFPPLPDFSSPQKENTACCIPEAPSINDLDVLVENIDQMTAFPKIDMMQLVDEWKKDNVQTRQVESAKDNEIIKLDQENFTSKNKIVDHKETTVHSSAKNNCLQQTFTNEFDISSDFDSPSLEKPIQSNIQEKDNELMKNALPCRTRDTTPLILNNLDNSCIDKEGGDVEMDEFSGSDDLMDSQANFMLTNDDLLQGMGSDDSNFGDNNAISTTVQPTMVSKNLETHIEEKSKSLKENTNDTNIDANKAESTNSMSHLQKSFNASLFDDSFISTNVLEACRTPVTENDTTINRGPSPSQFTFTQALACVHDSDSMDRTSQHDITDKPSKTIISNNSANKEEQNCINVELEGQSSNTQNRSPDKIKNLIEKCLTSNATLNNKTVFTTNMENRLIGSSSKENKSFTALKSKETVNANESQLDLIDSVINMEDTEDFSDEESGVPLFDLGFDIDEDIIPPSPCLSQTNSQKSTLKNLSQSLLASRKSLSFTADRSRIVGKNQTFGRSVLSPAMEDEELQCQLNQEQNGVNEELEEQNMSGVAEEDLETQMEEAKQITNESNSNNNSSESHEFMDSKLLDDFHEDFEEMPTSPILSGRRLSQKPAVSPKNTVTNCVTPISKSPYCDNNLESPLDDSFVIRKKRKKALIIDSPVISQNDFNDFKTPLRPVISKKPQQKLSSTSSEEESLLRKKPSKSVSFCIDSVLEDMDSDFDESILKINNNANNRKRLTLNDGGKDQESSKSSSSCQEDDISPDLNKRKRKSKSPANPFLVNEAEVSEDEEVSSDEADGSDQEHMEDSFVSEGCTQLSQGQHEELQAIYLKSVRTPVGQAGKFKLKYDYDSNINVYSQVPQKEESQYYEDSFVCDEEEHSLLDGGEITMLDPGNILDNDSYVGPRTRWSKPRKQQNLPQQKIKRKRVQRPVESSSEDECDSQIKNLISPDATKQGCISNAKTFNRRQIMSSSEDEQQNSRKQEQISPAPQCIGNIMNSSVQIIKSRSQIHTSTDNIKNQLGNNANEITECSEDSDLLLNIPRNTDSKPMVIVDSREINGAQDIVSTLRFQHNVNVVAAQLDSCDYVVSVRMGIDRKQWSEFSNGANRAKMTERLQHMCDFYERPCLIIEKDKCKGDEKGRPLHWTKYVDKTLVQLVQCKIMLFFTETQVETAAIISELCHLESRKNCAITCPINLNSEQLNKMKFYRSIPHMSYVHCLFLCNKYKTVGNFMISDIDTIMNFGHMTKDRATDVYNYLRRTFDSQMLPSNYT